MDDLYRMLKEKIERMREEGNPVIDFSFDETAKMYQFVCLMMQIQKIVEWVK